MGRTHIHSIQNNIPQHTRLQIFHYYNNRKLTNAPYVGFPILMCTYLYNRNLQFKLSMDNYEPQMFCFRSYRFRTCIIMPNPTHYGEKNHLQNDVTDISLLALLFSIQSDITDISNITI